MRGRPPLQLRYSGHAEDRLAERGISKREVDAVLMDPDVDLPADKGRRLYARQVGSRRISVVVDSRVLPWTVVTVWDS